MGLMQQQVNELARFTNFVKELQVIPPHEIFQRLTALGYRGQDAARRSLSLMAYRHVRRIKRLFLEGRDRADMMPKGNFLCAGPTGCGKTHMVELLFRDILRLPTVIVDVTNYSETGYVGQDTNQILTRLLHAADGNPLLASIGIVCLDEFDKLASGQNNAVFAGAGTTKDVTGMGVQRELLKLLESSEVSVPVEMSHSSMVDHIVIATTDVAFVACGAFSGFNQVVQNRTGSERLGFGRQQESKSSGSRSAGSFQQDQVDNVANFQAYGFLPELIGRFTRLVPFKALDHATLRAIMHDSVIRRLTKEFQDEGMELVIEEDVLDKIVDEAVKRETGARGLTATLTLNVEDAAFLSFGRDNGGRVRVLLENGHPKAVYEF
jgi:ATP-dependent Clp protease ATP-binding subunit ClpX